MKLWLMVLLLANLVGAAFGFFVYYADQFRETPLHLWLFVPDCPLYAALIVAAVLLLRKNADWFVYLVAVGAAKYGVWTVGVLAGYSGFYFSQNFLLYSWLFVSHVVLALEPLLLVGAVRVRPSYIGLALGWFLLNDFADYVLGTHPLIPDGADQFLFPATVAMTFVFSLGVYKLLKSRKAFVEI